VSRRLEGRMLPDLKLPATTGREMSLRKLGGRLLLIVYPWTGRPGVPNPPHWDDIPGAHGSTPELEGFRDLTGEFAKRGIALYGVGGQDTDYQGEMAARLRLGFPILSDAEGHLREGLDLPVFATGGVIYLKRLTLLINRGHVERVFYPVTDPGKHASIVLDSLNGTLG